jgi:hypothetical protein
MKKLLLLALCINSTASLICMDSKKEIGSLINTARQNLDQGGSHNSQWIKQANSKMIKQRKTNNSTLKSDRTKSDTKDYRINSSRYPDELKRRKKNK